ncbi:MAG: dockerin type I domain-containing protein, partial [Clostridiales bacterium]|nr:dockerin type I domain-containing protein [Clostridiales bacterium]
DAGMKDSMLGTNIDRDALAKSLGFLDNWEYNPTAIVTPEIMAAMDIAMADAYNGLKNAYSKNPLEPYFVNGLAQPIFPYGNSIYNDTSGEGVVRFIVYVETDLDTDGDGKLDLVKTLVQLPRAALDGMKCATIYEARPYIEGCNSQSVPSGAQTAGNTFLNNNPGFSHEDLYATPPERVPAGETTTAAMVANANYRDWYYRYSYSSSGNGSASKANGTGSNETEFEDLNWYDYFLVRGFAVVECAGVGSDGSEGFTSCGADIEINGFKAVIEWLTGDRKAYSDKTNNIEVKADWSNGCVGMTGRSYAGTTQFGLATSGVDGLKTIVPVAGIASWYEYTNGQGVLGSSAYSTGLAWYVTSRLASPDWSSVFNRYAGYSQLMRREETALGGEYGPHWLHRDYTVENWFRDWGPSKIKIPMLIVHGLNDNNVRPKQSIMMYQAAQKAGTEAKFMWHQGDHMTPTFPRATPNASSSGATARPYSMYCGDYTYDEWLNLWFSHHLYGLDNNVMEVMPNVLVQDNDSAQWVGYDSWDCASKIILDNDYRVRPSARALSVVEYEDPVNTDVEYPIPGDFEAEAALNNEAADEGTIMASASADGDFTVINSANGNSTWTGFLNVPTAGSTLYEIVLPEDVTVKGVVEVHFRAAISSLGSSAGDPLRVHAKLVEVAAPGTNIKYFGSNTMGSSPGVSSVQAGGAWQGGGVGSYNLVRFNQATNGTYRELGRGWMNLCTPLAKYDSYTAAYADRINPRDHLGEFYDYTIYLQPSVHTAKAGNRLVCFLTTGSTSPAAYTGNSAFTFTVDNEASYVVIPVGKPETALRAYVNADAESDIDKDVEFTLSVSDAVNLLNVELEFEVDGDLLAGKGVETLNGFTTVDGILWTYAGGNVWKGSVTLGYPAGGNEGLTSYFPVEIAKFVFAPRAVGDALFKLTGIKAVGLVDDVTEYVNAIIEVGEAVTNIDQRVFSKYDLNRDNKVDALDLGIMLLYCGFDKDSPNWDTLVKVNDSRGKGVTASMCDVNGDGVIDMLDLLDLFIHYTK